jgi:hypothetical protein
MKLDIAPLLERCHGQHDDQADDQMGKPNLTARMIISWRLPGSAQWRLISCLR